MPFWPSRPHVHAYGKMKGFATLRFSTYTPPTGPQLEWLMSHGQVEVPTQLLGGGGVVVAVYGVVVVVVRGAGWCW